MSQVLEHKNSLSYSSSFTFLCFNKWLAELSLFNFLTLSLKSLFSFLGFQSLLFSNLLLSNYIVLFEYFVFLNLVDFCSFHKFSLCMGNKHEFSHSYRLLVCNFRLTKEIDELLGLVFHDGLLKVLASYSDKIFIVLGIWLLLDWLVARLGCNGQELKVLVQVA